MKDDVFVHMDNIADGEVYLKLAADMEDRIAALKLQYKATGDRKIYYDIQEYKKIQREHRDTARLLLDRGERRKQAIIGRNF